jgi:hypothetical protein
MTKFSSFRGFASTKEAGERFIMEKTAFLLYLAHKKRLIESTSDLTKTHVGSIIELIAKNDQPNTPKKNKIMSTYSFKNEDLQKQIFTSQLSTQLEMLLDMK